MIGISIIIPCKNEEKYVSLCIDSLLRQEEVILEKEIIVVDNGSTDNTINILDKYGAAIKYFVRPDLPIAGLRNFGVEMSMQEWIAFVDADVEVDKYWAKSFIDFLKDLENKGIDAHNIITGSTCLVPKYSTWIEQIWYQQLMLRDSASAKYINSGNMILHRELFNKIGGFNMSYKTGEEEKLCEEARLLHNGIIIKNDNIKAVHHGYPKTIPAFFNRMRWHGMGMKKYLLTPWKSKPLILAIYYLLLAAIFTIILVLFDHLFYLLVLFLFFQFVPVFLYAMNRCKRKTNQILLLTFLYFCFGWARAISLFDMLFRKEMFQKKQL